MFGGWQEGAEPESIKTVKKAHATAPPLIPSTPKQNFLGIKITNIKK
jgi:hypothetical protein